MAKGSYDLGAEALGYLLYMAMQGDPEAIKTMEKLADEGCPGAKGWLKGVRKDESKADKD